LEGVEKKRTEKRRELQNKSGKIHKKRKIFYGGEERVRHNRGGDFVNKRGERSVS